MKLFHKMCHFCAIPGEKEPETAHLMRPMVLSERSLSGVVLNTLQPRRAAVLYLVMSPRNPCGLTCLPHGGHLVEKLSRCHNCTSLNSPSTN